MFLPLPGPSPHKMVLYTSAESARNTAFPENGKSGWGLLPAPGGPLGQLLACTSQELQRELAGKQSAKVLVLGGNGTMDVDSLGPLGIAFIMSCGPSMWRSL